MTGPPRPPRQLTANLCGGRFDAQGWATFGPEPRYGLNATLIDADLARCAREAGATRQNLRGKLVVTADLTGSGRTRNSLTGRGSVRLSDGDIYDCPS